MLPSNKNSKSKAVESNMERVWSEINLHEMNQSPPSPSSGAAPATALALNSISDFFCPFPALSSSSPPNADRRYKRMMKNRESASRSRARKQAYVNGLQLKIAHLVEENEKLKDQIKKLVKMQDEAAHQHPRKHLLPRTKTAPF